MKIKAKISFDVEKFHEIRELVLVVKFKYPKKTLPVKLEKVLASGWWVGMKDGYKNVDEFREEVLSYLRGGLDYMEVVQTMVQEYHKEKTKMTSGDIFDREVHKLLNEKGQWEEIEIELED